ncbi:hypothetical protein [Candidatus Nitrosopumilus salaria]|uniref:hypothetical protein n=1 Tax=Candidatus Nitrosopumilus salarius TaxID=1170320 RepID=UPI001EE63DE0|nr:hypothetical protein [Candidatus Nitrosopumilus salaria]
MNISLYLLAGFALILLMFPSVYSDDLIVLGNGHAPIYMSNSDSGRYDLNGDGNADYFVKAHYAGNYHQKLKIDYKIQDECVDLGPKDGDNVGGDTFDDAAMKIGFSTIPYVDRDWTIDGTVISNPWFNSQKNDDNRQIALVSFPNGFIPSEFPSFENGDDVIQGKGKKGSFKHLDSISELGGQSGWTGSIYVTGPVGNFALWTIHPSGGYGGCDGLTGFGIPIFIAE